MHLNYGITFFISSYNFLVFVLVWDVRRNDPIFSLREMDSDVTKMITNEDKRLLVCSSGDGCITTINMVSRKLHLQVLL